MPADHPTRDNEVPPPVPGLGPDVWTYQAVKQDALRLASSWVRLALLLQPHLAFTAFETAGQADAHLDFRAFVRTRGFDSSLGFPGEGPLLRGCGSVSPFSLLSLSCLLGRSFVCLGFSVLGAAQAMDTSRVAKGEAARTLSRGGKELKPREKLKELLEKWLFVLGHSAPTLTLPTRCLYAMVSICTRLGRLTAAIPRR